jgi:hypothetical protein
MKKNYFFIVSVFLLLLSLVAFSDNLFYDIGQESNSDPKFVIHGLFFLAWFIILVIQSKHVRERNIKAHIKLGMWGMGIAIGVIISTFYVFYTEFKGWSVMPGFVKANRIFTVTFTLMVLLAYIKRKNAAAHKRLLFVGTVYVLGPVIGRVADKLCGGSELSYLTFELVIWNGLFISLFINDLITLKKVHKVSWIGFIWFYIIWAISVID